MRAPLIPGLLLAGLGLPACYEKPTLSESWQLDRLRILAVRAEPAEPQPGEEVNFTALVYSPDGAVVPTIWFACLPDSADDYGCEIDPALMEELESLDPENLDPDDLAAIYAELVAAGLIGATPYFEPTWTAPEDALAGLDEIAAREGVSAVVTIQAVPEGADSEDDVELAYKRLPISLAETPNHNPAITQWTVGGQPVEDGATITVGVGEAISIAANLAEDAVEDYIYVDEQGASETRTEEPYFTWYASGGAFDDNTTLYPINAVGFSAPEEAGTTTVAVTVRDRRGGMGWATLTVVTE